MADGNFHKTAAEMHLPQDAADRDSITKLNAVQSPLLRLPAEIRNTIYTFVFSDQIYEYKPSRSDGLSIICRAEYSCLGLLLASRQVHHETALLPYKLATFVLDAGHVWFLQKAHKFLAKRSEAQLAALGRMELISFGKTIRGTGAYFCDELDYMLSQDNMDDWPDV